MSGERDAARDAPPWEAPRAASSDQSPFQNTGLRREGELQPAARRQAAVISFLCRVSRLLSHPENIVRPSRPCARALAFQAVPPWVRTFVFPAADPEGPARRLSQPRQTTLRHRQKDSPGPGSAGPGWRRDTAGRRRSAHARPGTSSGLTEAWLLKIAPVWGSVRGCPGESRAEGGGSGRRAAERGWRTRAAAAVRPPAAPETRYYRSFSSPGLKAEIIETV